MTPKQLSRKIANKIAHDWFHNTDTLQELIELELEKYKDGFQESCTNVMDVHTAVFNCHLNDAKNRAKVAFIKRFGILLWKSEINEYFENGIMGIFDVDSNQYTSWFAEAIAIFVNEDCVS